MVSYKAKKFRSKYKINNKTTVEYLKMVIHKSGYNISTYSDEMMKLVYLGLDKKAKRKPALSIMDDNGNITVYYNDKLPINMQRFSLSHELGHIELGHFYLKTIGDKQEREANEFAKILLSSENNKNFIYLQLACVILCITFCFYALSKVFTDQSSINYITESAYTQNSDIDSISDNTICYFTRNSEVYHIYKDCYYIKNSNNIYSDTIEHSHKERLCSACERRLENK